MKIKGRGILVCCLLLFGGYTTYDFFRDQKKEEQSRQDSRLMTLDFQKVDHIEVQKEDRKVKLSRSVDGWVLEEPIQDLADSTFAEDFIKNIYPERIIEVAKEGETVDWALYGLDQPLGTVLLKTADGKENFFEVSKKLNFESNGFVRRNKENRVLVVSSLWQGRVEKYVLDFRDRRFLRHKIASVDEVTVKNEKGLFEIHRVDGKWDFKKAQKVVIDQNKVRELLSVIADARAADLKAASQRLPDLKPLFTMDLVMDKTSWKAQIYQAKDKFIYATVSEPKFFMKLEPGALDKFITLTPQDLKEEPLPPTEIEKLSAPSEKSEKAQ